MGVLSGACCCWVVDLNWKELHECDFTFNTLLLATVACIRHTIASPRDHALKDESLLVLVLTPSARVLGSHSMPIKKT